MYSCARDLAFGPAPLALHPGMGPLFINEIQYNIRILFCGGLRRQTFEYVTQNMCLFVCLRSRDVQNNLVCIKILGFEIFNVFRR